MAFGDIALTAGMRNNLVSLQSLADLLNRTQTRLATGKKVNSALDDPVAYFAALAHTSQASDLDALKNDMNEAIQAVTSANNGITGILSLIEQAKSVANSAKATSDQATRTADVAQYNSLLTQIDQLAADSGYGATNFLAGDTLTVNFNSTGTSSLDITGTASDSASLGVTAAVTSPGSAGGWDTGVATTLTAGEVATANGIIDGDIALLDAAKNTLKATSQSMSSNLSVVSTRIDFTSNMENALVDGANKLTLADTNEEGANMLALQTRNQLGIVSLSLAGQAAQSVLRLFP